jgi:AcrR family transcriptional regulator
VTKGDETRQLILERAFALASRLGLEGLTIGALAEAMDMSKSGLFAHFKSKEALQLAVIDHAADRFRARVVLPTLQAPRGEPRARALVDHWLTWYREETSDNGCFFVAAAFEVDDRPGPVRARIADRQREWDEFLTTLARKAVEEGHFRADLDARQFAFTLHGISLVAQHHARLLGDRQAEARARRAFDAVIDDACVPRRRPRAKAA